MVRVHQSLLLLFAWRLMPMGLGPVAEPALIVLATVGGCALLHECVIRRVRWLRPLFGLDTPAPAHTPVSLPSRTAVDLA